MKKEEVITSINENTIVFSAPAIFCFSADDKIELKKTSDLYGRAVYFSPTLVNSALTLEKIKNLEEDISESEYRDYCLLMPFINRDGQSMGLFDAGPATAKQISKLIDCLHEELTLLNNSFWRCRSRSFMLEILFFLQYIYTDKGNTAQQEITKLSNESNQVNEIILYLHTHYDRKISIDELTKEFHINRTTLADKFTQATGMSVMEYLIRIRIRMAAIMLGDTMLPVSEIAYRVGFNDITHFGRMFRKYKGYSPSEYRKSKQ